MSESQLLDRKSIIDCEDIQTEKVEVPEWGGYVFVRSLTGKERDSFEASIMRRKGNDLQVEMRNMRAKLAILTVVDDKGKRIFNQNDVETLGKKSAAALQRVFNVAQRLSGISQEDVDELTKNFDSGPSDDSGLDLPEN